MVNVYIQSFSRKSSWFGKALAVVGAALLPLVAFTVYVLAQQGAEDSKESEPSEESPSQVRVQLSDESIAFDVTVDQSDTSGREEPADSFDGNDQPPLPEEFDLEQDEGPGGDFNEASTAARSPSDLVEDVDSIQSRQLKDALRTQVQLGQVVEPQADPSQPKEPKSAESAAERAGPVRISISDGDDESGSGNAEDDYTSVEDVARDLYGLFLSELGGSSSATDDSAETSAELPELTFRELPSLELPVLDGSIFTITTSPFDLSEKGESTIPNWRRPAR